jgi:hypothetical protein
MLAYPVLLLLSPFPLAVMPINGNANDIITIPFDRDKTNITWVTMTNTYTLPLKAMEDYFK